MKHALHLAVLGLVLAQSVHAQSHGVAPSLLENTRRLNGDTLSVCADVSGRTLAFDKRVAQMVGDALFLDVEFHEGFGGFPTSGDGFLDELQIAMTNRCDVMLGMTVQETSPFPDWAVLSRAYVSLPYVMLVRDDYENLGAIPRDRHLGTALSSMGERVMITWNQQQPKDQRFKRWPYADMQLMATRILDGSIGGGLIWAPAWAQLQMDFPAASALKAVPIAPVPETVTRIGMLMKTRDSFLRAQVDQALDSLIADGSIDELLQEFNWLGKAGDDRGAQ